MSRSMKVQYIQNFCYPDSMPIFSTYFFIFSSAVPSQPIVSLCHAFQLGVVCWYASNASMRSGVGGIRTVVWEPGVGGIRTVVWEPEVEATRVVDNVCTLEGPEIGALQLKVNDPSSFSFTTPSLTSHFCQSPLVTFSSGVGLQKFLPRTLYSWTMNRSGSGACMSFELMPMALPWNCSKLGVQLQLS